MKQGYPRFKVSLAIITKNEARNIASCIKSVPFADEVIVVDSHSTDGTVDIALQMGASVYQESAPQLGTGILKQEAVNHATFDWVLCLDADEQLSPELAKSIEDALYVSHYSVYRFKRCTYFLNKVLQYGEAGNDYVPRLFNRTKASWSKDKVHERILTQESVGLLKGCLIHHTCPSLKEYIDKQNHYTSIQAEVMYGKGKRSHFLPALAHGLFRFIRLYFFKLGFLDGGQGFIHILVGSMTYFMKYIKIWALHYTQKK